MYKIPMKPNACLNGNTDNTQNIDTNRKFNIYTTAVKQYYATKNQY